MTAQPLDIFDLEDDPLQRDRWGRPLLIPAKGGERVPYTRASTLANFVTDHSGLHTWEKRLIAVGLGQREDLCALAASLPRLNGEKCDKTTLTRAQLNQDRETNKQLDEILELAKEAAAGSFKARYGTTIHNFTDPGADVSQAPERMQADIQSFHDELDRRGIEILATETFVANDELMAAGSFDHLARVPGYGVVVVDKKTGQVDGKGLSFGVQLSVYANAEVYDCFTDKRAPLESLTGGERINRAAGLIAHIPLGGGRTDLHVVNLRLGQHAARLATQVRAARQLKDFMTPMTNGESA